MSLLGLCRPCRQNLLQRTIAIRSVSTQGTTTTSSDPYEAAPPPVSTSNNGTSSSPPAHFDPERVYTSKQEYRLHRQYGLRPIGSRRRRVALSQSPEVPFEQLPYQCFQEALKFLREDRQEKIAEIETQRGRIERLKERETETEEIARQKHVRLAGMHKHLEWLKVQADINDPLVKKRFEDGKGDMNRPIYRYLAQRKWRARRKLITEQRINQMHIVPDILPAINLKADVDLLYPGKSDGEGKSVVPRYASRSRQRIRVMPGQFIASLITMEAPRLQVQIFEPGERLVTIAAVDPDIPNVESDSYDSRCIYLAANIPLSNVHKTIDLNTTSDSQTILPWTPPYAHKGAPYHRIPILIFEQPENTQVDVQKASETVEREGFTMRTFADRHRLRAIGAHLFRTQWDEWMQKVMRLADIPGAEIEYKFQRVEPLPKKKRDPSRMR